MKEKPKTAFECAFAARKGDMPKEQLTGAAKRLFNDKTISTEQLQTYSTPAIAIPARAFNRVRSTFKRG